MYQRDPATGFAVKDELINKSYPVIPASTLFQKNDGYGYEQPVTIEGWQWSLTMESHVQSLVRPGGIPERLARHYVASNLTIGDVRIPDGVRHLQFFRSCIMITLERLRRKGAGPSKALPVLSYHTGAGWAEHGQSTTVEGAKRLIMRFLPDESLNLIKKHGFTLNVFRRTPLMQELNGGPDGFVYSIGKQCGRPPITYLTVDCIIDSGVESKAKEFKVLTTVMNAIKDASLATEQILASAVVA